MSDRLEEIKRTFRQYYGTYRADMEWLVAEVARLVAETQRLTRERDDEKQRADAAAFIQRYGTPFDPTGAKTGTEIQSLRAKVAALRAAGQLLRKALSYPADTQFAAGAITEWARLTEEQPT